MKKYLISGNISENILYILAWLTFWSGLCYKFFGLKTTGVTAAVLLTAGSFLIVQKLARKYNQTAEPAEKGDSRHFQERLAMFLYLAGWALSFYLLRSSGTGKAIISPWQEVPAAFFILYLLVSAVLFWLQLRPIRFGMIFLSLHYFLTFGVALAVYRPGFGFDYFIHQATMELADRLGAVDPRPLYYLGQYGLLLVIHKLTSVPLDWLHRLLTPALAAVFLPLSLENLFARRSRGEYRPYWLLFLLFLPLPFLTFTTPQNFALLLLLLAVIIGFTAGNFYELGLVFALALAALVTHPVAGIPALVLALGLVLGRAKISSGLKRALDAALFTVSALALPLAFVWLERIKFGSLGSFNLRGVFDWPQLTSAGQENAVLNFIYLYGFNLSWIVALLILAGLLLAWRRGDLAPYRPFLSIGGGMLAAYFITKMLPFNFLITYERDDYAARILLAAVVLLSPFLLAALAAAFAAISRQNRFIRTAWLVFGLSVLAASLYLAYPRHDRYFNSRGYSVGAADVAAVRWVESDASGDYIVLANQEVSAAALHQFGFKRYYRGDIFYYPIPTGGPLYQYYLDMVYKKPSSATMREAMDLAGVKEGYFVLNKYWWAFPKVLAEAKLAADSWQAIDEGEVYVFKYRR